MTKKIIWVLTRSHNEYDQHGEYFEAAFAHKPSLEQLAEFFKKNEYGKAEHSVMEAVAFLLRVQSGGGRTKDMEDVWFDLKQVTLL